MKFSLFHFKNPSNFSKKIKKSIKKNKYFLYNSKTWSNFRIEIHNKRIFRSAKVCVISNKKRSISSGSNISDYFLKKLVDGGNLCNLKKST